MKKVLKFAAVFFLLIIFVIAGFLTFCAMDKKSVMKSLTGGYSVYIHTDSAFEAINPLLDLQAAEVLLASPDADSIRGLFNTIKASPLRSSKIVKLLGSRKVDLALYQENGLEDKAFTAIVDLSFLSFLTRFAALYPESLYANTGLVKESSALNSSGDFITYFKYSDGKNTIFIKPVKNLVIISSRYSMMISSCYGDNGQNYTEAQKKILSSSIGENVRIVADARKLAQSVTDSNPVLNQLASLLPENELSVVYFSITDEDISIKCQIPFVTEADNGAFLGTIMNKNSGTPELVSRLGDTVQYYTLINAGTLSELKEAFFPLVPKEKEVDKLWESADGYCKTAFSMSLDDLLFSWTGTEFAVLGVENQNDPVFALQIKDEAQRQKIFEKITESMFVKNNDSLIVGGVRIPQLMLPSFLNWILSALNVNIPSPYFIVSNGYIYFSESAECLSSIYSASDAGKYLVKNDTWKQISSGQKNTSAVSLYYNLDRSVPFFLRGKGSVSKILALYSMGRFDGRIRNNILEFQLHSVAVKSGSLRLIPGFPVSLEGSVVPENFCVDSRKKPENLFWVEKKKIIKKMDLKSLEIISLENNDSVSICAAPEKLSGGGVLWSVSDHGEVNLYDSQLNVCPGFPVITGGVPSALGGAWSSGYIVTLESGQIAFISGKGELFVTDEADQYLIKSRPAVYGSSMRLYAKGFSGSILSIENGQLMDSENPMEVQGIGLGSPVVFKNGLKTYTAFITQAGLLHLWSDGKMVKNFPVKLNGVFFTNVSASSKYIYALSSEGVLYRTGLNGGVLGVKIPDVTGKNAYLYADDGGVYVNPDGNMIYGFKENMELMRGFPLTGWGCPVFADINGDKIPDCISLTLDKKIIAWSLR